MNGDDLFTRPVATAGSPPAELPETPVPAPLDANAIPPGQRNDFLASMAGSMRRIGMAREEILASLVQVNLRRCKPPLTPREVEKTAVSICRYEPDQLSVAVAENHWAQDQAGEGSNETAPQIEDPGPIPDELLRVPGFVSQVMDYCIQTAPYPNRVMAFSGAIALQAFLAGRKVRDPGDNRTNLYLLGLAHSAAGKDWPRKVNTQILHHIGLADCLGDRFASSEGIQDAMFITPSMLFQTDEIDGMLQSINKAKDARHEATMGTLLTMYSSANSVFPMRRKAGMEAPGAIDQPCLVVFGTAIPNHYYEALSDRMLTNGFFAQMLILESGKRGTGQEPDILDIPKRVLDTAKWWADFRPGTGNLENWHADPAIVSHSDEAKHILVEARTAADQEYAKSEEAGDPMGTTVWGRCSEQARKLALIHAISENREHPVIGANAARWATAFVIHQTRRMLFMAQTHVADNPFHAMCLKLLQKLQDAPGQRLAHSVLLRRMKIDARTFTELVTTLEQRGDIAIEIGTEKLGRPSRHYRLINGEKK